jgi:hypothetical protein
MSEKEVKTFSVNIFKKFGHELSLLLFVGWGKDTLSTPFRRVQTSACDTSASGEVV